MNDNRMTYEQFRDRLCEIADKFIRDNGINRIEVNFSIEKSVKVSIDKKNLNECTHFSSTLE